MAIPAKQIARGDVLPRYNYSFPSVAAMVALGMQSKVLIGNEFQTGLVINDRLPPDRYVLTQISGLGGADVREVRAPRPAAPGEIAYDAYLGGRTLVFDGTIESGSVARLEQMAADLRASVSSVMTETQLKFNWWDIDDLFIDTIASKAYWKLLAGAMEFGEGIGFQPEAKLASGTLMYHNLRQYTDVMVAAHYRVASGEPCVLAKLTNSEEFIRGRMDTAAKKLIIELVTPGKTEVIHERSYEPAELAGLSPYLMLMVSGNLVGIDAIQTSVLKADPPAWRGAPMVALTGEQIEIFGTGLEGFAGLQQKSTAQWVDSFVVRTLYPCDFVTNFRIIQAPQITQAYQKGVDRYRRDFQITMRSAKPFFTSPIPEPSIEFQFPEKTTEPETVSHTVVNKGNAPAPTVFTVTTPAEAVPEEVTIIARPGNPTVQTFRMRRMKTGTTYIVNSESRTITDSEGHNAFNVFVPGSDWIMLEPGENEIQAIRRAKTEVEGDEIKKPTAVSNVSAFPAYPEEGKEWGAPDYEAILGESPTPPATYTAPPVLSITHPVYGNPGTPGEAVDDGAIQAGTAWTNPEKALRFSLGEGATCEAPTGTSSHALAVKNLKLEVPEGATIHGIQVAGELQLTNFGAIKMRLIKNKEVVGIKEEGIGSYSGYKTWGGPEDLWGRSWTVAEVNNANFGLAYSAVASHGAGEKLYFAHAEVTVYYTLGGVNSKVLLLKKFGFAIPGGSTIMGIEVHLPNGLSWGPGAAPNAHIWYEKLLATKNIWQSGPQRWGGPKDAMNGAEAAPTPAQVNSEANFGIGIVATAKPTELRAPVYVTIYYKRGAGEVLPLLKQTRLSWHNTFV